MPTSQTVHMKKERRRLQRRRSGGKPPKRHSFQLRADRILIVVDELDNPPNGKAEHDRAEDPHADAHILELRALAPFAQIGFGGRSRRG